MTLTATNADFRPNLKTSFQAMGKLPLPVMLYLLGIAIPVGVRVGPLAMTSIKALLIALILPITFRLATGAYGRIHATDILFFLHILWSGVALAVNNPDQVVEQLGSVGIEFIGAYALGRAYIRSSDDFAALCRWLMLIVLCLFPLALFETVTGRPILVEIIRKVPGVFSVEPVSPDKRMGLERVQGIFAHPIHFGLFCSVVLSLVFVGLRDQTRLIWRWAGSAIVGFSGFLALSSGALLAILLQMGLFGWSYTLRAIRWRWWAMVGLFVLAYIAIDVMSNRTPIKVFMSYATFSAHTAYWRSIIFDWGMVNVWKHPWFGLGLNDWERPSYMISGSMDNFWLVMAVRYGIPGFITIALGYGWAVAEIMARNLGQTGRVMLFRRAWVFTFLGLAFTLSTVHVWGNVYSFVAFMFGAGMWLLTATPDEVGDVAPAPLRGAYALRRVPQAALPRAAVHLSRDPAPVPAPKAQTRYRRDLPRDAPRYSRFSPKSGPDGQV